MATPCSEVNMTDRERSHDSVVRATTDDWPSSWPADWRENVEVWKSRGCVRTRADIDELDGRIWSELIGSSSKYPDKSYEVGVLFALRWMIGDIDDPLNMSDEDWEQR
jgi:hypothetical protein